MWRGGQLLGRLGTAASLRCTKSETLWTRTRGCGPSVGWPEDVQLLYAAGAWARVSSPSAQLLMLMCTLSLQYALKIDKLDRRKDLRGGTVKAEHKVRAARGPSNQAQVTEPLLFPAVTSDSTEVLLGAQFWLVCLAQVLAQLQGCKQVCRLVPNGEGTWEGRAYLLMELLGLNLAMYQRAYPHNGRIHPTEAKRIGVALQTTPSRPFSRGDASLQFCATSIAACLLVVCLPGALGRMWLLSETGAISGVARRSDHPERIGGHPPAGLATPRREARQLCAVPGAHMHSVAQKVQCNVTIV